MRPADCDVMQIILYLLLLHLLLRFFTFYIFGFLSLQKSEVLVIDCWGLEGGGGSVKLISLPILNVALGVCGLHGMKWRSY